MALTYTYITPLSDELFEKKQLFASLQDWGLQLMPSQKDKGISLYYSLSENLSGGCKIVTMEKDGEKSLFLARVETSEKDLLTSDLIYEYIFKNKLDSTIFTEQGYIDNVRKKLYTTVSLKRPDYCIADIKEIKKSNKELIHSSLQDYLSNRKLLGTVQGFKIRNRKISLRYDDEDKIKTILNLDDSNAYNDYPILFIRTENTQLVKKIEEKYSDLALLLYDDDPELLENLQKKYKNAIIPTEESITCYCNSRIHTFTSELTSKTKIPEEFDMMMQYLFTNGLHNDTRTYEAGLLDKAGNLFRELENKINTVNNENMCLKKDKELLKAKNKENIQVPISPRITTYDKSYNKARSVTSHGQLLQRGDEKDLYDGEVKDIIISALKEYRDSHTIENSRRRDIVDDILKYNPSSGICSQKAADIKNTLKTFDGKSPKMIADLERLGFTVKGGNHIKLKWYGDSRYSYTLASTPSDVNAGKNNSNTITNLFL